MKNKFNILEALENAPEKYLNGQKFYTPICGVCTLTKTEIYCLNSEQGQTIYFDKNGTIIGNNYDAYNPFTSIE